jgi:hypothetical protein
MQPQTIALVLSTVLAGPAAVNGQTPQPEPGRTAAPTEASQPQTQQQSSPPPQAAQPESKLTFEGDTALWTVAIRPDKTADFERVMQRLRDALMKSGDPARQRQAEGWRVVRLSMPLPDGNIAYVHVVNPVVPGADYTVMQILYDAFPDERQMLYELYRGAFASNLALATGRVAVDLGTQAPSVAPAPATPGVPSASPTPPTPPTPPGAPTSPGTAPPPASTAPGA